MGTFAVDTSVTGSCINHSRYAALKVKDAVVDRFRARYGSRPSVQNSQPDLRVNVHIRKDRATVSLDLSGESLHLRGYRTEKGAAPLRENLAAAILMRAGWPGLATMVSPFIDPMCGSGTLPIEAALMAGDVAPGLYRTYFGFLHWRGFERGIWRNLLVQARFRAREGLAHLPSIAGYDIDGRVLKIARENLERAGLGGKIGFERRDFHSLPASPGGGEGGLLVVNPPFGGRMGEKNNLRFLYAGLGQTLRDRFAGWQAAVFTGNPELAKEMGLRAHRKHVLFNGPIRCELLHFKIRS
jgi:23S rRNA (guanine2445-N2)-methyltransferase / 23S rRNA (guanine2069-N7)-methyltransferase